MDIDSLTLYALDMVRGEPNPVDIVLGANKREIFALARANIQSFGRDTAINNVPQTVTAEDIQRVRQHVAQVFPEIN